MNATTPHYLLFSEARPASHAAALPLRGRWRFVLESMDGSERFEASDEEPGAGSQRLDLLAVVRGLEALDQPSRVTLVTSSSYVSRGIRSGLAEWREHDWMWERFGKMTPVKDDDLWKRVDRALRFHGVECRTWRFDPAQESLPAPMPAAAQIAVGAPVAGPKSWQGAIEALLAAMKRAEQLFETVWQLLTAGSRRLAAPLTTGANLR